MQVNQDFNTGAYTVRSYGTGHVVVIVPADKRGPATTPDEAPPMTQTFQRSIIITPSRLIDAWPPQTPDELRGEHFDDFAALQPALVLIGTGAKLIFPNPAYTAPLLRRGIGVEVMNTAAACRTYNFLVSDGRDVAVALMMI